MLIQQSDSFSTYEALGLESQAGQRERDEFLMTISIRAVQAEQREDSVVSAEICAAAAVLS